MKRAAHFLSSATIAYSPPNDAIVNALLELGYEVDLYAPDREFQTDRYGERVRAHRVEYGKRWILHNVFSARWRKYRVFSGTSEDPMSVVGLLSFLHRRPSFALADEIYSGSYRGNAPERWKKLCRWGMRRSRFNIVNDSSRVALQREYVDLPPTHRIIVYPGCFLEPPAPGDPGQLRREWQIPSESLVLAASGGFNSLAGAEWLIKALQNKPDLYAVLQPAGVESLTRFLMKNCRGGDRLYIEPNYLSWHESWASMAAVDIGMVIYFHTGPQFQNMGISSNRLCMFLSMGVPVIASRQSSFEFLEKYECGVLAESEREFIDAIGFIQQRLPQMKTNARRCAREYIDAPGKYRTLVAALESIST